MAAIALIFPYQWRGYWRAVRSRGRWKGANIASLAVIAGLQFPLFLAGTLGAIDLMRSPETVQLGVRVLESLLSGLFIVWLVLPLLTSGVMTPGEGISVSGLLRFPLGRTSLFVAGCLGALIQPVYWVTLAASGMIMAALAMTPHPLPALLAGGAFIASGAILSWGISLAGTALFTSRRGRDVAILLMALFLYSFLALALVDIDKGDGGITMEALGRRSLIVNRDATQGLLITLGNWSAAHMVYRAATGEALRGLPPLAALAAGSLAFSLWAFGRALRHPVVGTGATSRARRRAIVGIPFLEPALGAAAEKEVRYLLRTLDGPLGIFLSVTAALYLVLKPQSSLWFAFAAVCVVMTMELAVPFNIFGLDRTAIDRYRLVPLSGRDVIRSKNIAYFILVGVQLLPLWLVSIWRLGVGAAAAGVLGAGFLALLMAAWGNQVSVREPAPRRFFNLDSKEQAGGLLSFLVSLIMVGLMFAVILPTHRSGWALVLGQAGLLGAALVIYRGSLGRAAARFDDSAESMRRKLA